MSVLTSRLNVQGDRVEELMQETQPAPIRIKLVTQLEGSYLDDAQKKRLAEQLAPGAVNIIQKYVQVRQGAVNITLTPTSPASESPESWACEHETGLKAFALGTAIP
jgi:hypothetical protein